MRFLIHVFLLQASAMAGSLNPGSQCIPKMIVGASGSCSEFASGDGTATSDFGAPTKNKTTSDQVFYQTAVNITGLSFSLAANTSYYFEYDINHQSTATACGVWFGLTYPSGSTITWTASQAVSLTAATISMSRGAEFTSAAGATVDAANSTVSARIIGTISTKGSGTLQPRVKAELATGRGAIMAGSGGRIAEQ